MHSLGTDAAPHPVSLPLMLAALRSLPGIYGPDRLLGAPVTTLSSGDLQYGTAPSPATAQYLHSDGLHSSKPVGLDEKPSFRSKSRSLLF